MNENVVRHLRDVLGLEPDEITDIYGIFQRSLSECLGALRAASDGLELVLG